jgi:regulator of sigma E protease
VSSEGRWNFIGSGELIFEITGVNEGGLADQAGLMKGDRIKAVNGKTLSGNNDLPEFLASAKNGEVNLMIRRGDTDMNILTQVSAQGTIGIVYGTTSAVDPGYRLKQYTLASAFSFGAADAWEALVSNVKGLRKIFSGEEKATDAVQGPIGIAKIYGGAWDWSRFWMITGLLSMVLAFMNILPIPALDGGHVIFLTIESITRKKFSDTFMERSQIVGMVLLLALMFFAFGNDIWKHVIN